MLIARKQQFSQIIQYQDVSSQINWAIKDSLVDWLV